MYAYYVTLAVHSALAISSAELALLCMAGTTMFGLAGAPAQNAAIQRIAPNEMRGQVTALSLFMFTFFGALGSWVIGVVSSVVLRSEEHTSALQSLKRISYALFYLKNKTTQNLFVV